MRPTDIVLLLQLCRNQWKSAEEVRAIQDRKLRRLVQHAYANVPYYRRLFDVAGLQPDDVRGIEDLQKIPTSSKRDFARLPQADLLARGVKPDRCRQSRTSGATGTPLSIVHRREDLTVTNLGFLRAYMAHGFRPWQRKIEFTGSRNVPKGRSWYEHLGLMRRRVLSDADEPADWIEAVNAWQPHALIGYVMMLKQLAAVMQDRQITTIKPDVIFSTSALLDETTRHFLKRVFGTRVVDVYASEEGRCIAWECDRCSGYHVNADLMIVEVLDDSGQPAAAGQEGEVVLTNLHSFAMPFIRYRQGDRAVSANQPAACGRGFPLLKRIEGRADDFIRTQSGRKVSPRLFYYALWTVPGIAEFRLTQQTLDRVLVEIVTNDEYNEQSRQVMFDNLRELLSDRVEILLSVVGRIPRGPSEKLQSFVSLIECSGALQESRQTDGSP